MACIGHLFRVSRFRDQEHIGLQGIVKGGLTGGEDKEWWGWGMGQKLKKEEWGEELF